MGVFALRLPCFQTSLMFHSDKELLLLERDVDTNGFEPIPKRTVKKAWTIVIRGKLVCGGYVLMRSSKHTSSRHLSLEEMPIFD